MSQILRSRVGWDLDSRSGAPYGHSTVVKSGSHEPLRESQKDSRAAEWRMGLALVLVVMVSDCLWYNMWLQVFF